MILGKGRAGQAIQFALSILSDLEPELEIGKASFLKRGEWFPSDKNLILCFSNPNGLHSSQIIRANDEGRPWIVSEKPVCVDRSEASALDRVNAKVAILHVYRQMWGPMTIRQKIESGELGDIINIEGRYWHSSAAEAALWEKPQKTSSWKNDPKLCGPYDVLLDVGTHWLDMVCYLLGSFPTKNDVWLSYKNSEKPHRDTHLVVGSEFSSGQKTLGSISKTTHGMSDHFEFHVIGTKKMLSWNFIHPDEIIVGEGRRRSILVREESKLGSKLSPFRASGWLEGYIEILRQFVYEIRGRTPTPYPQLQSVLPMMKTLFEAEITLSPGSSSKN